MASLKDQFHVVRERPLPKEPLNFYQFKQGNRLFLTVCETPQVWQDDLVIGERLFADTVVIPVGELSPHEEALTLVKDVLKQRMKYPGAKEDPKLEQLAKTWVLPTKLHLGPNTSAFLAPSEHSVQEALDTIVQTVNPDEGKVHFLKIEVSNGLERQLLFKILDNGFRPGLLMVKWSYDMDDHTATAHCAGHLVNSGYSLVALENGYALYMFTDQPLYDITSMKQIGLSNPMMDSILLTVSQNLVKNPSDQDVTNASETSGDSATSATDQKECQLIHFLILF